jgi:hypothetical protein
VVEDSTPRWSLVPGLVPRQWLTAGEMYRLPIPFRRLPFFYDLAVARFPVPGHGRAMPVHRPRYRDRDRGRAVTGEAFDAVVEDLVATLDRLRVPEKEKSDLLGILGPMKKAVVGI